MNQMRIAQPHERLDALNDELHIIRRLLANPSSFGNSPHVMDVLRMAVDYTHSRYQQLAFEMRQEAAAKVNP